MKQVLFVSASHELPQGAFGFLRAMQHQEQVHVRGLFFRPIDYGALAVACGLGAIGPVLQYDAHEKERVAEQKALFARQCEEHYIRYDLSDNDHEWNKDLLVRESRFADLILVSAELFCEEDGTRQPNTYLREALHAAECPLIIVPEGFKKIGHIYIGYDGSRESMFALRQFAYLFPDLTDLPTEIMYAKAEDTLEMPDQVLLKKFVQLKFDNMSYSKLHFKASDFFSTWISEKKDALLVSGSFGRSGLSYLGKPSFVEDVIRKHSLPIFIAHT